MSTMQETQNITQRYFELSNAGNLAAIEKLLDPEATYSSANTGLYYGVHDIMVMMTDFFKSQLSLTWQIDSMNTLTEYIAEVYFTCNSEDRAGQVTVRTGIERIVVVSGLIRHIEVR